MKPRKFREYKRRVETGPIVFGPDWPGVFIRGDNANAYAFNLRTMIKQFDLRTNGADPILSMYMTQLADLLESCRVDHSAGAHPND